jgi:hypothetical protein
MEPDELDDVGHGWGEPEQVFHERGQTGVTVSPRQSPPPRVRVADRTQP